MNRIILGAFPVWKTAGTFLFQLGNEVDYKSIFSVLDKRKSFELMIFYDQYDENILLFFLNKLCETFTCVKQIRGSLVNQ